MHYFGKQPHKDSKTTIKILIKFYLQIPVNQFYCFNQEMSQNHFFTKSLFSTFFLMHYFEGEKTQLLKYSKFKIYKKTHTDQYLNWQSHHLLHQKLGVICILFDHAKALTMDRQAEIENIKTALGQCGYPDWAFEYWKRRCMRTRLWYRR